MNQAQPTTGQCTPRPDLGSILRAMPADDPGLKLRYAVRRVLNITLTEFATRLGVKRTHLYEVLRGNRVSASLCLRIAAALEVEVTDIFPASNLESSASVADGQE